MMNYADTVSDTMKRRYASRTTLRNRNMNEIKWLVNRLVPKGDETLTGSSGKCVQGSPSSLKRKQVQEAAETTLKVKKKRAVADEDNIVVRKLVKLEDKMETLEQKLIGEFGSLQRLLEDKVLINSEQHARLEENVRLVREKVEVVEVRIENERKLVVSALVSERKELVHNVNILRFEIAKTPKRIKDLLAVH